MRFVLAVLFAFSVAAAEPARFVVTTESDSGAGSLRQAILDVNAQCAAKTECAIVFEGVQTIRPLTALPAVEQQGRLTIDGGDARVVLDGSALTEGNGLDLRPHNTVMVRNLVIDRFPGHGIFALPADDLASLWLKNVACTHNRYRGLEEVGTPFTTVVLSDSTFDDNGYSGVALWSAGFVFASGNSFSRNGASGLFVLTGTAEVGGSTIEGNAQFGVAIARTANVIVGTANTIRANRVRNVDWNLDGESPQGTPGLADAPLILSAHYDGATGITTVHALLLSPPDDYRAYAVSASAGEREPDGTASIAPNTVSTLLWPTNDIPRRPSIEFTIELHDAPRGSWVSIWGTEYVNWPLIGQTTEIGRAVLVD